MSKDQIVSVGLRTFRPMACSEPLARSTPHICKSPVLAPPSADCVSGLFTSSNWNCLVSVSKLVLRNPTPSRLSCPVLAQSRHPDRVGKCPLSGVKQTSLRPSEMSASDPKRTFVLHWRMSLLAVRALCAVISLAPIPVSVLGFPTRAGEGVAAQLSCDKYSPPVGKPVSKGVST
jgi:hypothetical protein